MELGLTGQRNAEESEKARKMVNDQRLKAGFRLSNDTIAGIGQMNQTACCFSGNLVSVFSDSVVEQAPPQPLAQPALLVENCLRTTVNRYTTAPKNTKPMMRFSTMLLKRENCAIGFFGS